MKKKNPHINSRKNKKLFNNRQYKEN